MILIAGGGLAGLSAAFHLGGRDFRVIERETRPGGLCRTEWRGPYFFDYGGHMLHLKSDGVKGLVKDLIGSKLTVYKRRSSIYSHGTLTPYPFQVNTHGLPPEVIAECLAGFMEARCKKGGDEPGNFREWIIHHFGEGFARHFFFPFNEKFFRSGLTNLTTEWASWSVPRPSIREVIDGALGVSRRDFGYNVEFFYPEGGIEELPKAFAAALPRPIETGVELAEVIVPEKRARLSTGDWVKYDKLVSTVPLDRLLRMLRGAPDEVTEAAKKLRCLSVLCLNLAVEGPPVTDRHWIYLPENNIHFHRIGVYSNLLDLGPGRNSLYLEMTSLGLPDDAAAKAALEDYRRLPFHHPEHQIRMELPLVIEHGYVVHDRDRAELVPRLTRWLEDHDILLAGRYGRWEYSAMEDAIREGKEAAAACGTNS